MEFLWWVKVVADAPLVEDGCERVCVGDIFHALS